MAKTDEISILDLVAALLRQRWTVVSFAIIIPSLFLLVTLVRPRKWTAVASFMPQASNQVTSSGLRSLAGEFGLDIGGPEAGQSPQFYAQLVSSREVLGKVEEEAFQMAPKTGGANGVRVAKTLADILNVPGDDAAVRREAVIRWLQKEAVSVSTVQETGVVQVSVITRWPTLSAQIAQKILHYVNEFNLETRKSQASAERQFVEERMDSARIQLRTAEDTLLAFLQGNRDFQNSPELAFMHDRLERRVAMRQDLYTSLAQSYEQARIAEVRNTPLITVVQPPAEPLRPDQLHLALKVLLGLVLGIFVGIGAAFVREYLQRERKEEPSRVEEVSDLWKDTRGDLRRLGRRIGVIRS
jgi:uncharacterized protein involved in exopolysaccharide biosynthesis